MSAAGANAGTREVDVNAADRLQRVLSVDETRVPAGRNTATFGDGCGTIAERADGQSERWLEIERTCFRAERDGNPQTWAKAVPLLRQYLREAPLNLQALKHLARAQSMLGDRREALRIAVQVQELDPKASLGHSLSLLVATGCMDTGNWDAAVRYAEAALASKPGDAGSLEALVNALASSGKAARAEEAFDILAKSFAERAAGLALSLAAGRNMAPVERHRWLMKVVSVSKKPPPNLWKELGEVCLVLQRDQEALQWFQRGFLQTGGAGDVELALQLTQLQARAGRVKDALDSYRVALCASPESSKLLTRYAQLLMSEGRGGEAEDLLRRGIKRMPQAEAAPLYVMLAELQQSAGQRNEAKRSFEAAAACDEKNVAAWQGLALAASATEDAASRIQALRRLVDLEPHNAYQRHTQLGETLSALPPNARGGEDPARHFRKALELRPKHVAALLGLAKLNVKQEGGKAGAGAPNEALRLFEEAVQAEPGCVEALEGAGDVCWSRGDVRGCATWYKQLLKHRPDHTVALCRAAIVAMQSQDIDEAVAMLQHAVRSEPGSLEASARLGYAQLAQGHTAAAMSTLRLAMQQAPEALWNGTRLYWSLALADCGDTRAALTDFGRAVCDSSALQRLVSAGPSALVGGEHGGPRLEAFGLALLLPGAPPRILGLLSSLVESRRAAEAPATAAAPPGFSAPQARACAAVPAAASSGGVSSAVPAKPDATPASEPPASPPFAETWRRDMREDDAVEVYSKSAGRWIAGHIISVKPDVVKIKYLIDDNWCEKALLRSSDSLRQPESKGLATRAGGGGAGASCEDGAREGSTVAGMPAALARKTSLAGKAVQSSAAPAPPALTAEDRGPWANANSGAKVGCAGGGGQAASAAAGADAAARSSQMAAAGAAGSRFAPPSRDNAMPALSGAAAASHKAATAALASQRRSFTPRRDDIGVPPCPAKPAESAQAPPADDCPPQRRHWVQPTAEAPRAEAPRAQATPAPAPIRNAGCGEGNRKPELLSLDELQFGKVLGSGGFGAVYRGMFRGQEVAIKKLHMVDGQVSPMQLDEFRKEVANLQALRHQRLVSLVGAAYSAPSLCIVTEFMPNGSLYEFLHQRKEVIASSQRFVMVRQIAEGVDFLHGQTPPFVHRDLKSMNVVLDFELNVKLCDFGLTQSMEKTHISRRDNEGGSPRYMAPELFDCRGRITEKVDIWALGCLALEVITGRMPHEECTSIQQVMTKTLVDHKCPFRDLEGLGLSAELHSLAERCFDFQPKSRIDAKRFLERLALVHLP